MDLYIGSKFLKVPYSGREKKSKPLKLIQNDLSEFEQYSQSF